MPRFRFHHFLPRLTAMLGAMVAACSPEPPPAEPANAQELEPAQVALANHHLAEDRPDLSLAILAEEPGHPQVRHLLADHRWHLPIARLDHPGCGIHHLVMQGSSLWVGISLASFHTVVRWNLETLEIEAVLLPSRDPLRALVLSPTASHAIVARGDVTLLVDAQTLRPIADLGNLPEKQTPESVLAFRPDSLLVVHPDPTGWHIRDTATGEVLRSITPSELPPSPVLAAHLDTHRLRLLTADGTRIDIPISPAEPLSIHPFEEEQIDILHAHIIPHGEAALVALNLGPHTPPAVVEMAFVGSAPDENDDRDGWATYGPDSQRANVAAEPFHLDGWATLQPHAPLPCLANGLFRHLDPRPVVFADGLLRFHGNGMVPVPTHGTPVAYAADAVSRHFAVAETDGPIFVHRPVDVSADPDASVLEALAGHRFDAQSATLIPLDIAVRHAALAADGMKTTSSDALLPLWHRLADALHEGAPELALLPVLSLTPSPVDHSAAFMLASALTGDDPAVIRALVDSAAPLPPTLATLANARIRQLAGDTASAFRAYHDGFPDLAAVRLREDWRGWERAEFQPALALLENAYRTLIDTLTIAADADETSRRATYARLTAPESLAALGRARYATACLDAAMVLSDVPEENAAVFTLASLARQYGAPAVPCLRAEALALTTLESYREAHARWIELITAHPVEEHLPADYSEAAYTAFENDDARQAIEILVTGMARFEGDADFAIRAGWIALLAGQPEHAGAFLLRGRAVGFPEDQAQKATAMLAAAAVLVHDSGAATAYFQELLALDPAWGEPETLEALDWPDHLVAALRQLTW